MFSSLFRKSQLKSYWVLIVLISVLLSVILVLAVADHGIITIESPANNTWNRTANVLGINFTCNISASVKGTIENITLVGNFSGAGFTYHRTNLTAVANSSTGFLTGFNISLSDGHYNWSCAFRNETAGINQTVNNTIIRVIKVDATAPQITNITPNASNFITAFNSSNIFRFTITDISLNESGTRYGNFSFVWRKSSPTTGPWQNETGGSLNTRECNFAGIANKFNCSSNINLGALDSGDGTVVQYYITTFDSAGNYNSNGTAETPLQVTLDKNAPLINFINQTGYFTTGNWSSSNTITFYANTTENNTDTCVVYTNVSGSILANQLITNYTNASFTYTSNALSASAAQQFADGSYMWNATCNDSATRADTSSGTSVVFNVDATAPIVALYSPLNASYNQSGTVAVYFALTENNLNSCSLFTNATGSFILNETRVASEINTSSTNNTFVLAGMHDSSYLWNVRCNDSAGNIAYNSSNRSFVVDTVNPVINFINSTGYRVGANSFNNQNWTNSDDITFYINVTEDNAANTTCFIFSNMTGAWVANNTGGGPNVSLNYTSNALTTSSVALNLHNGSYAWNVTCNDSSGRTGAYATSIVFNIDTATPLVAVQSPQNLSYNSSATVAIGFYFSEANVANCSLFTNATGSWALNASINASPLNNTNVNNIFILSNMHDATYKVNVSCTDSAGTDGNNASDWTFTIDTTTPVLSNPKPRNNSGITGGTNVLFNITVTERNLNTSANHPTNFPIGGAARAFFKEESASSFTQVNLTCSASPNSGEFYCTNTTVNAGLTESNVMLYYFYVNDSALLTSNNATADTPFRVTVDSTVPIINFINATGGSITGNWSSGESITFYVNTTENNPDKCVIYTNASNGGASTNKSNVTFSYTNNLTSASAAQVFADGSYLFNATCNDTAASIDATYGIAILFNVDTVAPVVAINSPSNNSYNNSGIRLNLTFVVTENNLDSCDLYTNVSGVFIKNASALGTGLAAAGYNFTLSDMHDGSYLWNVRCNDSAGNNALNTSNFTVHVDATVPVINFLNSTGYNRYSAGANWSNSNSITFYVNVTDNNPFNATCTIYTNVSGSILANTLETNYTNASFSYTSNALSASAAQIFADGSYRLNVSCNDSANNRDYSFSGNSTVFNVDTVNPIVSINTPLNNSFVKNSSVNVTFTVTENNLDTCSLFTNESGSWALDHSAVASVFTSDGYNMTFTASDGSYMVNVTCNDSSGRRNVNASYYLITIDNATPMINHINQTGSDITGNWTSNGNITFRVNVSDRNAGICVVYTNLSNGGASTNRSNVTFSYTNNLTSASAAQVFADGSYLWNVTCNDSATNLNGSYGVTVAFNVDTVDPIASINKPSNNTFNSSGSVNISFTVTEANLDSCSLWTNESGSWALDHSALASEFTGGHGYNLTFTASDGSYMVNVTCNDSSTRYSKNASFYTITVDATAPVINYLNQTFRHATSTGNWSDIDNITFYVNVTELNAAQCVVYTNASNGGASTNASNVTISYSNGVLTSSSSQGFADGSYRWNATCNDTARNVDATYGVVLFSVDTVTPIIAINKPVNNSLNTTSAIINVTFTVTERNLETCSLYTNTSGSWALDHTANASEFTSGHGYNLSFRPASDGSYQLNITCNDSTGRYSANTSTFVVNVDANAPTINSINATGYNNNGNRSTTRTIRFYINATDPSPDKCVVFTNMTGSWASNDSTLFSWTSNALNATPSITVSADVHFIWNVSCNDTANNKGQYGPNLTLRIDSISPAVRLVGPANATVSTSSSIPFAYNASDAEGLDTCKIFTNVGGGFWQANVTNTSATADIQDNETVTHRDGAYKWNVECNDSAGNRGVNATNYTFTVDVGSLSGINYSQALVKNWNTLNVPTTTIMGTFGMTFANTQGWNISYVLSTRGKLDENYNIVYYNTDGTDSGWKSFGRGDWAGSSLQYVNNTNDKVYWINMSVADSFEI